MIDDGYEFYITERDDVITPGDAMGCVSLDYMLKAMDLNDNTELFAQPHGSAANSTVADVTDDDDRAKAEEVEAGADDVKTENKDQALDYNVTPPDAKRRRLIITTPLPFPPEPPCIDKPPTVHHPATMHHSEVTPPLRCNMTAMKEFVSLFESDILGNTLYVKMSSVQNQWLMRRKRRNINHDDGPLYFGKLQQFMKSIPGLTVKGLGGDMHVIVEDLNTVVATFGLDLQGS